MSRPIVFQEDLSCTVP